MLGITLAFLAAWGWAAGAVLARLGMQHVGAASGTFFSMVAGLLLTLIVAIIMDFQAFSAIPPMAILWFAILGALQFPFGRRLSFTALRLAGIGRTVPILGAAPIFAAVLAIIFLGERPTPMVVIGMVGVVAGIALVISERR